MRNVRRALVAVVLVVGILVPTLAGAQGSISSVSFQGELADLAGQPITDSHNMRFAIYDAATRGSRVWPTVVSYEQHDEVSIVNGLFNVMLGGAGHPLGTRHFDAGDRYLQVWVCVTAGRSCTVYEELNPRLPVASVAYALMARTLVPGAEVINTWGNTLTVERRGGPSGSYAGKFATSGEHGGVGVIGSTTTTHNYDAGGVFVASGTSGETYGVRGIANSNTDGATAGRFEAKGLSGATYGVYVSNDSQSDGAAAGRFFETGWQGVTYGVDAQTYSCLGGAGGRFVATCLDEASTSYGVYAETRSGEGIGVYGKGGKLGVFGLSGTDEGTGVQGRGGEIGVKGFANGDEGTGVHGEADLHGVGVKGVSQWGIGVRGETQSRSPYQSAAGHFANKGTTGHGVYAETKAHTGMHAGGYFKATAEGGSELAYGVRAEALGQYATGLYASAPFTGAVGIATDTGHDGWGTGLYGRGFAYGVYSDGDAHVEGDLTVKGELIVESQKGVLSVAPLAFEADDPRGIFGNVMAQMIEPPAHCHPFDPNSTWATGYEAPVYLPHGSKITRVTYYWKDGSPNRNAELAIKRTDLVGGLPIQLITVATSGSASIPAHSSVTASLVIDNTIGAYFVRLVMPCETWFYGAVIQYE